MVESRYSMRVFVLNRTRWNNRLCWHLNFIIPPSEVPAGEKDHFGLLVEKESNWPQRILGTWPSVKLVNEGDVAVVQTPPKGFPVELFPPAQVSATPLQPPGRSFSVSIRPSDGGTVVEALLESDGKPELLVRQLWRPGEPWWTEYERYVYGRKDLVARRVAGNAPAASLALPPSRRSGASAAQSLAADPDLRVFISGVWQNAPLTEVLAALADKTTLRMEIDPALAAQSPLVGALTLNNVPAWQVMEDLAKHNVAEGRWERFDGGYRLVAASPVFAPVVATPSSSTFLPRLLGGCSLLGAILACIVLFLRRKKQRLGAQPL